MLAAAAGVGMPLLLARRACRREAPRKVLVVGVVVGARARRRRPLLLFLQKRLLRERPAGVLARSRHCCLFVPAFFFVLSIYEGL